MGTGASAGLTAALGEASEADLQGALSSLEPATQQKIIDILSEDSFVVPETVNEVNEKWLTKALQKGGWLEVGMYVDSCKMKVVGLDEGLTSESALIELSYGGGEPKSAPKACVVKLPEKKGMIPKEIVRSLFQNEVDFYRNMASEAIKKGMEIPEMYFSACPGDIGMQGHVLVLEHMTHPSRQLAYQVGDLFSGVPMECALLAMKGLARLHVAYWNLTAQSLRGLEKTTGVPMFLPDRISHISDPGKKTWYAQMMSKRCVAVVEAFGPAKCNLPADDADYEGFRNLGIVMSSLAPILKRRLGVFVHRLQSCPQALSHGDAHAKNLFFKPGDEPAAAWFDFQTLSFRPAMWDVSHFLGMSLSVDDRASKEHTLVKCYHDELLAKDITDYTFDQCFSDYRFTAFVAVWNLAGLMMSGKINIASPKFPAFSEANAICLRGAAALEAASWADFLRDGPEDSEDQNPLDPEMPMNFE